MEFLSKMCSADDVWTQDWLSNLDSLSCKWFLVHWWGTIDRDQIPNCHRAQNPSHIDANVIFCDLPKKSEENVPKYRNIERHQKWKTNDSITDLVHWFPNNWCVLKYCILRIFIGSLRNLLQPSENPYSKSSENLRTVFWRTCCSLRVSWFQDPPVRSLDCSEVFSEFHSSAFRGQKLARKKVPKIFRPSSENGQQLSQH